VKGTVSQAWGTEPHDSRAAMALSGGVIIAAASLVNSLLWAAIIGVSCWTVGTSIAAEWFAGVLLFVFCAVCLVLNVVAGRAEPFA
jgi:hypothetical protein